MIQTRKKQIAAGILCFAAAAALLAAVATRVSPFYDLLYRDYGSNAASAAMIIGKGWLSGSIPYRDLFLMGGPLYFLLQAVGWLIGGRYGIGLLQAVALAITLLLTKKTLARLIPPRTAWILTALTLVPYAVLLSGGDSDSAFALPFVAWAIDLAFAGSLGDGVSRRGFLALGIAFGAISMINFVYLAPVVGVLAAAGVEAWHLQRQKAVRSYLMALLGAAVMILPFVFYFLSQGALGDMLSGTFVYPWRLMIQRLSLPTELLHKAGKCLLILPLMAAGLLEIRRGIRRRFGVLVLVLSLTTAAGLLAADIDWKTYLIAVTYGTLAIGMLLSMPKGRWRILAVALSAAALVAILMIPGKGYTQYLLAGVDEQMDLLYADLEDYCSQIDGCTLITEDTDCSVYLKADRMPDFRYFAQQKEMTAAEESVGTTWSAYKQSDTRADVMLATRSSWIEDENGSYQLVYAYVMKGGSLCIYLPVDADSE